MTTPIKPCPACGGAMQTAVIMGEVNVYHATVTTENDCLLGNYDGALFPREYADLCTQIESRAAARWVSVADALPETPETVQVYCDGYDRFTGYTAYYSEDGKGGGLWCSSTAPITHITHWMPLPAAPTNEPKDTTNEH